jgi:hypothetical protein
MESFREGTVSAGASIRLKRKGGFSSVHLAIMSKARSMERSFAVIPAGDGVNDNLHPFPDLRTVRIELHFPEQSLRLNIIGGFQRLDDFLLRSLDRAEFALLPLAFELAIPREAIIGLPSLFHRGLSVR